MGIFGGFCSVGGAAVSEAVAAQQQQCSRGPRINTLLLMGLFGGFSVLEGLSTVVSYGPSFSMPHSGILFQLDQGEGGRLKDAWLNVEGESASGGGQQ